MSSDNDGARAREARINAPDVTLSHVARDTLANRLWVIVVTLVTLVCAVGCIISICVISDTAQLAAFHGITAVFIVCILLATGVIGLQAVRVTEIRRKPVAMIAACTLILTCGLLVITLGRIVVSAVVLLFPLRTQTGRDVFFDASATLSMPKMKAALTGELSETILQASDFFTGCSVALLLFFVAGIFIVTAGAVTRRSRVVMGGRLTEYRAERAPSVLPVELGPIDDDGHVEPPSVHISAAEVATFLDPSTDAETHPLAPLARPLDGFFGSDEHQQLLTRAHEQLARTYQRLGVRQALFLVLFLLTYFVFMAAYALAVLIHSTVNGPPMNIAWLVVGIVAELVAFVVAGVVVLGRTIHRGFQPLSQTLAIGGILGGAIVGRVFALDHFVTLYVLHGLRNSGVRAQLMALTAHTNVTELAGILVSGFTETQKAVFIIVAAGALSLATITVVVFIIYAYYCAYSSLPANSDLVRVMLAGMLAAASDSSMSAGTFDG